VPEGHRHNHLFTLITYCRKRWADDWQQHVHELQKLLFKPPLSYDDVDRVMKSVGRKEYDYQCDGPWCDKAQCRRAEFGSGSGATDLIDAITKLAGDPVLWAIEMDGKRVLVTSDQLQSQPAFNRVCMDTISRCPAQVAQPRWLRYIDRKIQDADVVEAPIDATPLGMFKELLWHFIEAPARRAQEPDELLLGKVLLENGKALFKIPSLTEYLAERRFRVPPGNPIWSWLKDMGARSIVRRVQRHNAVRVCELQMPEKETTS
jgi:hypothetical protein